MLGDSDVAATIPTKDLSKAKKFYSDVLGLKQDKEDPGGVVFKSGNCAVYVYETEFAGTNKATTAAWIYKDIDGLVKDLKTKGLTLEHYDIPGSKLDGDVHVMGELKAIWFKDPDGNILSVTNVMG